MTNFDMRDFIKALHALKPERQDVIKKMQKENPTAFKYLVIYPFLNSASDYEYLPKYLEKKTKFFTRVQTLVSEKEMLDYFDELAECLYFHYPKTMGHLDLSYIEKLLNMVAA